VRKLILKMAISVDGFVSDLDGRNTWMFGADPQARAWGVETIWDASLHIMGARSFEAMAGYWQTSADVFAPPMNQIPKAVFSRRGDKVLEAARLGEQSAPLQPGAESWSQAHVAGGDLAEEIARLKAQNGKPIIAHGGVGFARSLVAHGLIDQYALWVAPVALSQGLPLFSDLATPLRLELLSSKTFPGGAAAQVYRPV